MGTVLQETVGSVQCAITAINQFLKVFLCALCSVRSKGNSMQKTISACEVAKHLPSLIFFKFLETRGFVCFWEGGEELFEREEPLDSSSFTPNMLLVTLIFLSIFKEN
jgi:hypothetical protein